MSTGNPRQGSSSALPPGLANDPFSYRVTASGELRVFRGGRTVTVLRGTSAERTLARLGRDPQQDQQVLARVTGNYRRGTERGRV
ncbi:hypothetical protein [Leucobacter chromiireducens]|uniref:hypothetical protein n=1 Tax=Leucobacter chromiireducens TaxID=283877 RepID=UPI000F633726|nr:hypothetical protein [Leucobacter chromiireducens]